MQLQLGNNMNGISILSAKARQLLLSIIVVASSVAAFGDINYHGRLRSIESTLPLPTRRCGWNECPQTLPSNKGFACAPITICRSSTSDDATASAPAPLAPLCDTDMQHMKLAASHARIGYGNTFPNPAVGCVLVRHDDAAASSDVITGSGFHPKAGMPHAEVFALLEACGHVEDGVSAARSVMGVLDAAHDSEELSKQVSDLLDTYKSKNGASDLFGEHFANCNVTAYVTLEPCCHVGQTPPCALSLVAAGVNRVVVGYRDPNPRVDGGGIRVLQNAGVEVQVLSQASSPEDGVSSEEADAASECSSLVKYFVKRISPRDEPLDNLDDVINGKKRRALRSVAGRQKSTGAIQHWDWPKGASIISPDDKKSSEFAEQVPLDTRFLERIDQSLWDHELVLLRLNNVVQKKKGAKIIGERIAEILNAHVAQVIGHTALLYRPGLPPVLDLDELVKAAEDNSD